MIVPNLERRFFLGTLCYDELNIGLKGRRLLMAAQLSVWKIGHGQISELTVRPFSATPQEPDEFIWLDITGQPDESHLNQLEQQLGLHEIALDNLFDTLHNPRLLEFEDHLLLGARCLEPEDGELRLSSFGIVISKNFLITAHEEPLALFSRILARVQANNNQVLRYGTDRFLYLILDTLIDRYYEILDDLSDRIDAIDDRATLLTQNQKPDMQLQRDILASKRQLLTMHRATAPLRDALLSLRRSSRDLISETAELYLRDVFEHILQLLDTVENYRDVLSSTTELIMSAASNRMNEIMTFLTVFTTFFIPVNFVTSYYGMNLIMPETHLAITYPIVIALLAVMIAFMYVWFRRKHWL